MVSYGWSVAFQPATSFVWALHFRSVESEEMIYISVDLR